MHRPIIVTDNRKMYSNAFEMTQDHQHLYHCVQPLEAGHVMFRLDDVTGPERNRNNFNFMDKRVYRLPGETEGEEEKKIPFWSWFVASFLMVVAIIIGYVIVFAFYLDQTAFNDVYLTQFHYNSNEYSIAHAGRINPLVCIIIAISCACSSILVGWGNQYVFGWKTAFLLFILTAGLQVLSIFLHGIKLFGEGGSSQQDTVMLTLHSTFGLHLASTLISLVVIVAFTFFISHDDKSTIRQTWSTFWLTVVEDLNTIVCYVFIVCACNAQSGVHDDTSTFFDVVCVVMIGFLQHIANILMIFHGHVQLERYSYEDIGPKTKDESKNDTLASEVPKIIKVIARTRLLIFFMIGILVVFFYLRITPTYEEFSLGIPYEIFRVLAIITMVSMNTLHSMWYELSNAYGDQKSWQSSPQWKIVTNLFIALVFSALVWTNVVRSNDATDKNYLDNLIDHLTS